MAPPPNVSTWREVHQTHKVFGMYFSEGFGCSFFWAMMVTMFVFIILVEELLHKFLETAERSRINAMFVERVKGELVMFAILSFALFYAKNWGGLSYHQYLLFELPHFSVALAAMTLVMHCVFYFAMHRSLEKSFGLTNLDWQDALIKKEAEKYPGRYVDNFFFIARFQKYHKIDSEHFDFRHYLRFSLAEQICLTMEISKETLILGAVWSLVMMIFCFIAYGSPATYAPYLDEESSEKLAGDQNFSVLLLFLAVQFLSSAGMAFIYFQTKQKYKNVREAFSILDDSDAEFRDILVEKFEMLPRLPQNVLLINRALTSFEFQRQFIEFIKIRLENNQDEDLLVTPKFIKFLEIGFRFNACFQAFIFVFWLLHVRFAITSFNFSQFWNFFSACMYIGVNWVLIPFILPGLNMLDALIHLDHEAKESVEEERKQFEMDCATVFISFSEKTHQEQTATLNAIDSFTQDVAWKDPWSGWFWNRSKQLRAFMDILYELDIDIPKKRLRRMIDFMDYDRSGYVCRNDFFEYTLNRLGADDCWIIKLKRFLGMKIDVFEKSANERFDENLVEAKKKEDRRMRKRQEKWKQQEVEMNDIKKHHVTKDRIRQAQDKKRDEKFDKKHGKRWNKKGAKGTTTPDKSYSDDDEQNNQNQFIPKGFQSKKVEKKDEKSRGLRLRRGQTVVPGESRKSAKVGIGRDSDDDAEDVAVIPADFQKNIAQFRSAYGGAKDKKPSRTG